MDMLAASLNSCGAFVHVGEVVGEQFVFYFG